LKKIFKKIKKNCQKKTDFRNK